MIKEQKSPDVRSIRAPENVNFLAGFDCRNPNPKQDESLAVRVIASRYRLRLATAREVCRMAGIGGAL